MQESYRKSQKIVSLLQNDRKLLSSTLKNSYYANPCTDLVGMLVDIGPDFIPYLLHPIPRTIGHGHGILTIMLQLYM